MTSTESDSRAAVALTHLGRTIESITRLVAKGRDMVETDEILRPAAEFLAIRLGQDVARLPEDWREQHPGVPWRSLRGLGNRIADHPYEVDFDLLWEVLTAEVASIRRAIWPDITAARELLGQAEAEQGECGGPPMPR